MAMKEVKLTINVEGILKKCQSMDRNDASITSVRTISHMNMLKRIIKNNLKIESKELSEQKKETILKIIKNNIFQHLTYSLNEDSTMRTMVYELLSGDEEDVKCVFISLANTLINPDPLIYNPEHGINRQFDTHRKMIDSVDLSR
ncbi:hypothetical protein NEMIN01_2360, partial [Nematocida minor]|uniref:uncharacterized protein n=1 Tax=Nematocida minor TaxID=1912983 RepID=UPI0022204832